MHFVFFCFQKIKEPSDPEELIITLLNQITLSLSEFLLGLVHGDFMLRTKCPQMLTVVPRTGHGEGLEGAFS